VGHSYQSLFWGRPIFFAFLCAVFLHYITDYRRKVRKDALDASLKQEMLQRGMSADDIVRVLEAQSKERG
jgi:hypothetical protein